MAFECDDASWRLPINPSHVNFFYSTYRNAFEVAAGFCKMKANEVSTRYCSLF